MSVWDETKHPRDPEGSNTGGQFTVAAAAARQAAGLPPKQLRFGVNSTTTGLWAMDEQGRVYMDGPESSHADMAYNAGLDGDGDFSLRGWWGRMNTPKGEIDINGHPVLMFYSFKDYDRGAEDRFAAAYFKVLDKLGLPDDVWVYKTDLMDNNELWKGGRQ